MSGASMRALTGSQNHRDGGQPGSPPLIALVYRSRACRSLSPADLHELTSSSQGRNKREAVTGLMLYDNGRFFQWLEGPPEGVDRVMASIQADSRHTDVDILDARRAEARAFAGWSMKLATPGPVMTSWRRDVIKPPGDIMEGLRARPAAAPALLVKLVPRSAKDSEMLPAEDLSHRTMNRKTAAILKAVFLSSVVPNLRVVDPEFTHAPLPSDPRALELADLLVAADQGAASDFLSELQDRGGSVGMQSAVLFEPAARRLGDLWMEDSCTEFDVTLGLSRLQAAARLLSAGTVPKLTDRPEPAVLIVPEPGERHRLGAALDGSVLRDAGWSPQCAYPADTRALEDILASTWVDVLDLSLSTAFRREDTLPRMTQTITQARRASQNPDMAVVVAGRVFVEEQRAGLMVGADHASTTSMDFTRTILKTLAAVATPTVSRSRVSEATVTAC